MADWIETNRGLVLPRHCDHYGHMNVRYYTHFFDDGTFHLWSLCGLSLALLKKEGAVTVAASSKVDFVRELVAGDLLMVEGAFTKVGGRSVTYRQRMFNVDTGVLSATQEAVEVFFDPETRRAADMPAAIRSVLEAHLIAPEKL